MRKWTTILLVISLVVGSFIPSRLFETTKVNAQSTPISLGFSPADAAMDPELPVVYLTKLGSKNVTAVNYETGQVKTIVLPYPSEHIEVYGDYVYATQQKVSHDRYSSGNGGIAIIKRSDFSLVRVANITIDPMDIAIDKDGYLYITPGSGQWVELKVINLADFTEVPQTFKTTIYAGATIFYNKENSKIYTVDSEDISPMDIDAFEVDHGKIINHYDSPYHGDYLLETEANITPDGLHLYNHSGAVFDLAPLRTGDMTYSLGMGGDYYDFAFSLADNLTFAANSNGGIDVFTYNTDEFLYSLKENVVPEKLLFKNGLFVVYADKNNKYYCEFITDVKPAPFSVVDSAVIDLDNWTNENPPKLTDGMVNVPINSIFALQFPQNLNIRDLNGITLAGSNGNVPIDVETDHGSLFIQAENLDPSSNYTLSIKKEAMTGYLNEALTSDLTYSFKTKIPPITNLSVAIDSNLAPKEFRFNATSTGGENVEYKFSVYENGTSKVLQEYSSSSSFTWMPKAKGTFRFKVEARNAGSTMAYEKQTEFYQTVTDNESPTVTITKSTDRLTNKPVSIQVSATDNIGVQSIQLPNNVVVSGSNATYEVSKNGTYYFYVKDIFGNTTNKEVVVTNIDTIVPKIDVIPSTTEVTLSNVLLVANASDASGIAKIILPNGSVVNGTNAYFPVSKNGTYKFIAEDAAGNRTTKSIIVSNIRPPAPSVSAIWNSHTRITGKTTPNASIIAKVGSKVIGQGKALQTGQFSITIPKQSAGTIVVVTSTFNGGTSNPTKVTVLDKIAPSKPVVNKVTTKTTILTGKAEKYATVYVYAGSKYLGKGKVDSNGAFRITIAKQRKGTKLSVYAIDSAKNKSGSTIVTVY